METAYSNQTETNMESLIDHMSVIFTDSEFSNINNEEFSACDFSVEGDSVSFDVIHTCNSDILHSFSVWHSQQPPLPKQPNAELILYDSNNIVIRKYNLCSVSPVRFCSGAGLRNKYLVEMSFKATLSSSQSIITNLASEEQDDKRSDFDGIKPTIELITLLDSVKEMMGEHDDLYDDDFASAIELYERELEKTCVRFIKDLCK
jgi:hypothetical protein